MKRFSVGKGAQVENCGQPIRKIMKCTPNTDFKGGGHGLQISHDVV